MTTFGIGSGVRNGRRFYFAHLQEGGKFESEDFAEVEGIVTDAQQTFEGKVSFNNEMSARLKRYFDLLQIDKRAMLRFDEDVFLSGELSDLDGADAIEIDESDIDDAPDNVPDPGPKPGR